MFFNGFVKRHAPATKVLFILKHRDSYTEHDGCHSYSTSKTSGLYNSARFVADMLEASGVECKIVQVIDNNCIDREVTAFQPTHVIIEALWIVPEKFAVLERLHPKVQWVVRGHSEIPFLSNEGIAVDWLCRYVQFRNVSIATNSLASVRDLRVIIGQNHPDWSREKIHRKVLYLPNYYPFARAASEITEHWHRRDTLNVACFGAIRPLKNNLIQAIAAIRFANLVGKTLRFHINGTRSEQGGNNNLKNIRALFAHTQHELVEHPWLPHSEFLALLRHMDISMNVSFTESFNIVAADSVVSGVPIVTSPEVSWSSSLSQASPTSTDSIMEAMCRVTQPVLGGIIKRRNITKLKSYAKDAKYTWLRWIKPR